MSIALRGNLEDFGIGEVFQLIGQQRKTGVLEISNDAARVQLRFDAGAVVSAAPLGEQPGAALGEMLVRRGCLQPEALASALADCGATLERLGQHLVDRGLVSKAELDETEEVLTSETLFDLLRENRGSFHFAAQPVPHERDPGTLLGAEEILMEGLRKVDEWRTLARTLPPEDAVLRRKRNFEVYAVNASEEARRRLVTAERVYLLVDGRLTLRRVIDLSHLGTFEGSRIVADLIETGVVEPLKRREKRTPAHRAEGELPRQALLVGAAVLAVLAALAIGLHLRDEATTTGTRVSGAALPAAREAFEARRLRNAVDAFRAAHGEWPASLELVAGEVLDGGAALTPPTGEPYYFRRSGDGVVLLTPER